MLIRMRWIAAVVLAYLAVIWFVPLPAVVSGRISQIAVTAAAGAMGLLWSRAARWSSGRLRIGIALLGVPPCRGWWPRRSGWWTAGRPAVWECRSRPRPMPSSR
ncbi:hypothetical protein [Actinoplanes sp. NPDC026619]|uniref:hypothetical protein n=1 Tax=Actinoplanes sp. NPDC026619 TaxID=3155798 RepID=UPI0033CDE842